MSIATTIANIPKKEWCGIEPRYWAGKFMARITCNQCGIHHDFEDLVHPAPQIVLKYFRNRGWLIGNRTKCPICAKPAKAKEEKVTAKVTLIKSAPSEAARKAKPMVYVALLDYYDEAGKRYKDGHTDRTIADELGVAEAFVKKIREEDFGPLGPPNEVSAFQAELAALRKGVEDLEKRMSSLCLKNGWAI